MNIFYETPLTHAKQRIAVKDLLGRSQTNKPKSNKEDNFTSKSVSYPSIDNVGGHQSYFQNKILNEKICKKT